MVRPTRARVAALLGAVGLSVLATCTRWTPEQPVVVAVPPYNPPPSAPTRGSAAPPSHPARPTAFPSNVRDVGDTTIRVLLTRVGIVQLSAPGVVTFSDRDGAFVTRSAAGGGWHIERQGRRLRAIRDGGAASAWVNGVLTAMSGDAGLLSVSAKPYRGDVQMVATDSGIAVINVVRIDDYLRGVVPLEIGTRSLADSSAVQAQAVTARSYAYIHLAPALARAWDVTAGTQDQVYGGAAAETQVGSEAVETTRTLVLKYGGRIVNAPYSSTCGGSTAAASEIWRSNDEPYLQHVSDEIPGTGRYYCDIAPRFRWTRAIDGAQLNAAIAQYLASYVPAAGKRPGAVKSVGIASHTPSGRVGTLVISTERGNYTLRGNDVRYVLRPPGGEILNSTYFNVASTESDDGSVARLVITGNGYGHGVGMCQWGAIGRARAGQDFRTILATYYPGTTVGPPE